MQICFLLQFILSSSPFSTWDILGISSIAQQLNSIHFYWNMFQYSLKCCQAKYKRLNLRFKSHELFGSISMVQYSIGGYKNQLSLNWLWNVLRKRHSETKTFFFFNVTIYLTPKEREEKKIAFVCLEAKLRHK